MRILKQPSKWNFEQPVLNRVLKVHAMIMETRRMNEHYTVRNRKLSIEYYDARTRSRLDYNNWRVKLIRRFGT